MVVGGRCRVFGSSTSKCTSQSVITVTSSWRASLSVLSAGAPTVGAGVVPSKASDKAPVTPGPLRVVASGLSSATTRAAWWTDLNTLRVAFGFLPSSYLHTRYSLGKFIMSNILRAGDFVPRVSPSISDTATKPAEMTDIWCIRVFLGSEELHANIWPGTNVCDKFPGHMEKTGKTDSPQAAGEK